MLRRKLKRRLRTEQIQGNLQKMKLMPEMKLRTPLKTANDNEYTARQDQRNA